MRGLYSLISEGEVGYMRRMSVIYGLVGGRRGRSDIVTLVRGRGGGGVICKEMVCHGEQLVRSPMLTNQCIYSV